MKPDFIVEKLLGLSAMKPDHIVGIRKNMGLFSALGFHWDRSVVPNVLPIHSIERVAFRFHRMLPEFVWDASVLEGNPFTFPEVKTLLDGVTIGGRKISDQEQVLNLATSSKHLLSLVKAGKLINIMLQQQNLSIVQLLLLQKHGHQVQMVQLNLKLY